MLQKCPFAFAEEVVPGICGFCEQVFGEGCERETLCA